MELDASKLLEDPMQLDSWDQQQLYSVPAEELAEAQLGVLRARFEDLRPRIRLIDRLAEDIGVTEIRALEDITPLCLPHTTYKSYSASLIDQGRYDKLTTWLSGLTTHSLSNVDLSACTSLEAWMDEVEAATPLRPLSSSGTSGKMSFFPRSNIEEVFFIKWHLLLHGAYEGEPDSTLASGAVDYYTPWPVRTGHHNMPTLFRLLRDNVFDGAESRIHTLGDGHWDLDLMYLANRLNAAQARGELAQLDLTPRMRELQAKLNEQQTAVEGQLDEFLQELFVKANDKRIFLFAPYTVLIPLAQEAKKRGMTAGFTPDSYVMGGGGSKGATYPDGWYELCKEVVPHDYQSIYGMTELTGTARICSGRKYHLPPWTVLFLLDPDSSVPLPRTGIQTGRFAAFDLWAETYWGGSITGDQATVDWRGGCSCGRLGPFMEPEVTRYSSLRDDDKISCSKSPDAYAKAIELTLAVS